MKPSFNVNTYATLAPRLFGSSWVSQHFPHSCYYVIKMNAWSANVLYVFVGQ